MASKPKLPQDYVVSEFSGLISGIEDQLEVPKGATPDSLNWITGVSKDAQGNIHGDHIELRRGTFLLGKTRETSLGGRVSGLGVGFLSNGTQVPFFTYGRHIMYYNATTQDVAESGSSAIPVAAANDDVSVASYNNLAGNWVYMSSPNSSIYKLAVANPGSVMDFNSVTYRGYMKMSQNRMFLWNRQSLNGQKDFTGIYLSYIDKTLYSAYTAITGETGGTGDGATKTFSGTLAHFSSNPTDTPFQVQVAAVIQAKTSITAISKASQAVITSAGHTIAVNDFVLIDSVSGMTQINNLILQVVATSANTITVAVDSTGFGAWSSGGSVGKADLFTDDRNGNLTSLSGGTGTINYITAAYSVTFNTAPINSTNIVLGYLIERYGTANITDFSFTGGGRTVGQGDYFRQDDGGGNAMSVNSFSDIEYCLHQFKTWQLQLTTNDTNAANLLYRANTGVPYFRAAFSTGDGIVYVDTYNQSAPKVRVLTPQYSTTNTNPLVLPESISDQLNLTTYGFSSAVLFEFGDYYILACKDQHNGVTDSYNSVVFIYNKIGKFWNKLQQYISCAANYNGSLITGDSISNNVFVQFSGYDDDGSNIVNYWTSANTDLNMDGLKRFTHFEVEGLIQKDQSLDVYFSFDNGSFVKVKTISGTGPYVNSQNPQTVGSNTIGNAIIGGGGVITALPYALDFQYATDIFELVAVKFVAKGIGYVSIQDYRIKDIRRKGRKVLAQNTA